MDAAATTILNDIVLTLKAMGCFAHVGLGRAGSESDVPRAHVEIDSLEHFRPDDSAGTYWVRLGARISLHTRSNDPAEAVRRMANLCAQVCEALLEDAYRGGFCQDLPIGEATQIVRRDASAAVRRPEVEGSVLVYCHYAVSEDA